MKRRGIRIIELATVGAALGMILSLAVPTYLELERRSRIDRLLETARSCRGELARRLEAHASRGTVVDLLGAFVRACNRGGTCGPSMAHRRNLFVLEPAGTEAAWCARDGRIHVVPVPASAEEGRGPMARLVVTDRNGTAGPNLDGILAVYEVGGAAEGRDETGVGGPSAKGPAGKEGPS